MPSYTLIWVDQSVTTRIDVRLDQAGGLRVWCVAVIFRERSATSAAPAGMKYQQATGYLPVELVIALETI